MESLRYIVIIIVSVALATGIWARFLNMNSGPVAVASVAYHPTFQDAASQVQGTFEEPFAGSTGFEVSFPGCARPLGILPVSVENTAIPSEYRYGQGQYESFYVYNGSVYPEKGISYRLRLLYQLYRFQSFFGLSEPKRFALYLKIWVPSDCTKVSTGELAYLQHGLIAQNKPF